MTSFEFQQTRTLVPANVMAPRKENKKKQKPDEEGEKAEEEEEEYIPDRWCACGGLRAS